LTISYLSALKSFPQWILSVEVEACQQQERREKAESAYRRGLRQTLWSIPVLALLAYLNFGFKEPAPWTEQEIFEGTNTNKNSVLSEGKP